MSLLGPAWCDYKAHHRALCEETLRKTETVCLATPVLTPADVLDHSLRDLWGKINQPDGKIELARSVATDASGWAHKHNP